jgi:hypothetical protein
LKETILKPVSLDIYDQSTVQIASLIFDYLKEGGSKLKYISYGILKNRIGNQYSDEEIIFTARILSVLRKPLLEEKYELFYNEEPFPIDRNVIEESLREGSLIHPETGDEILNFQSSIRVYYVPSEIFIQLLLESQNG